MGKLLTYDSIACRLGKEAENILILQRTDGDVFNVLPMIRAMRDAEEWECRGLYKDGSILYLAS